MKDNGPIVARIFNVAMKNSGLFAHVGNVIRSFRVIKYRGIVNVGGCMTFVTFGTMVVTGLFRWGLWYVSFDTILNIGTFVAGNAWFTDGTYNIVCTIINGSGGVGLVFEVVLRPGAFGWITSGVFFISYNSSCYVFIMFLDKLGFAYYGGASVLGGVFVPWNF